MVVMTMKYKKAPNLYSLQELRTYWHNHVQIDGEWYLARPLGLDTLSNRLKLAWAVFTGKYDAVRWPGNQ